MIGRILSRLRGVPTQETRSLFDAAAFSALTGPVTASGQRVNARVAENLSTVLACVGAISTAIASLPVFVYRRVDGGREEDDGHPLARLIQAGPNPWQSWVDWVEWTAASALLRGNALSEVVTDSAGAVMALNPIPWDWVSVQLLPTGRLAYDVTEATGIYGGSGRVRRLLAHEVLHIKDRSDDGMVGRSRLSRAAETVGGALAVQNFAGSIYKNGINPSGAIKLGQAKLPEGALTRLREGLERMFAGSGNAARALILEGGAEWQQISVSPEDAELLASRRFTTEELARLYQVPPPIVGIWDHSSFTNSETAGRWFAQFTLAPWIRKIEAEFARSVLTAAGRESHHVEFDLSGFLRGDPAQRWQGYDVALRNRVLTPNEVRQAEGYNRRPGGDAFPDEQPQQQSPTIA
ncbi:phage portal protein [Magnetospirillum sp. 64-120]|uniref:phage portal protein n=1 Tax=Magnetospirillum sp. 64-120 TaxID=1895778 RepID=UPI000A55E14B|nr:phage portal protein [Magnetospirillum sp. 64-120]